MGRRRNGFESFMEGFNGTYNTSRRVMRDVQMAQAMKETPTEYQQYTPEQAAQIEEAAKNGTLETDEKTGLFKGFEPAAKRYSMKGFDSDTMPTDRELTGLRMARMADIEAKFGDPFEAMRLRTASDNAQWQNTARARQETQWGREDDEFKRKESARGAIAEATAYGDPKAQQEIETILRNPDLPEEAKAPYRQWAGKTQAQSLRDAATSMTSAGNTEGADAASARAKKMEEEGVPRVIEAVKQGVRGKQLEDMFNSTGIYRAKDLQVKEVKDAQGNVDYIVSGDLNGKRTSLSLGNVERQMLPAGERIRLGLAERQLAASQAAAAELRAARIEDRADRKALAGREAVAKAGKDLRDYASDRSIFYGADGKKNEGAAQEFVEYLDKSDPVVNHPAYGKIPLSKLNLVSPSDARVAMDDYMTKFYIHKAAEKATGKRLKPFNSFERADMESGDWGLAGNKGLSVGQALWNKLPGNKEVIRLDNGVTLDMSDLEKTEYGELIKNMVGKNAGREARKAAQAADGESPAGLREAYTPSGRAAQILAEREGVARNREVANLSSELRREEARRRVELEAEEFRKRNQL